MPADGYLRRILVDGALPFRYRGSVRALLGEPDGPGLLRPTPPAPQPQFSYPRSAWTGETEVPDGTLTMARRPRDWPGDDRPRDRRDHGPAADEASHGGPDETPEPATGHPPALPRPAVTAEPGPQPGATSRPSVVTDVSPAPVHGPAAVTPAGPVQAEAVRPQAVLAEAVQAEAVQAEAVQADRPRVSESARYVPAEDAWPAPAGRAAALARRGPAPTASADGSRELLIPGRTARSSVATGSEQADARPDPAPRRPGGEPARMDGLEPAATDGSGDRSTADPGRMVRRIPPRQAAARKHEGGTVIPGGQAAPDRLRQPAGPGRQADTGPADLLLTPPPRRPVPETGISRVEPPPAPSPPAAPVSAPQIVVTLPSRVPAPPRAFWERRHLGRLWSRPLR